MLVEESKLFQLSPNQEDMWRSHYLSSNQNQLNMYAAWVLPKDIDFDALAAAFQGIVDKYETLRTSYHFADNRPYQKVIENQKVDYQHKDLSNVSTDQFNQTLLYEAYLPFDLEKGKLFKARTYINSKGQHVLLFVVHHLAIDGWSIMVMMKELGRMYEEYPYEAENRFIGSNYHSFVQEQNEKDKTKELEYWTERLERSGGLFPVDIPSKNSVQQSFKGEPFFFYIDSKVTAKLKEVAKRNRVTLYMLLLTAYQLLLQRYSNQECIWVATPFARRNTKTLDSVGFYANTVFIDGHFSNDITFNDLVQQVNETYKTTVDHKDISFSDLTTLIKESGLGEDGRNFTNVMFSFQNIRSITKNNLGAAFLGVAGANGRIGPIDFEVYPLKRTITQFELELEGVEYNRELHFRMIFDPDRYYEGMIKRLSQHFLTLLEKIVKNDSLQLRDYSFLSKEQVREQLIDLNPSSLVKEPKCSIVDEIEKHARTTPKSIAVTGPDGSITYEELVKKSDVVAKNLIHKGISQEERIAIALKPGVDVVIGILGILKAGAVYVPLDLSYPHKRLEYMIQDANISLILCNERMNFADFSIPMNSLTDLLAPVDVPLRTVLPHQLAYIIYTSGSTGKPKGVMVSHENIYYSNMARKNVYSENSKCNFLLLSSISFDSSLVGLFWTLSSGGNVILSELHKQLDISNILDSIRKHEVTHMLSVPSFIQLLFEQATKEKLKYLACVIVAGEQFPKSLHNYQKMHYPHISLFNEYGPTEGTVWSSYYKLKESHHSVVPIGFPASHAKIYILDNSLQFVPKGTTGEIYLAGHGIARGYNNQPGLTSERFLPNPYGDGDRLYQTGDLAKYNEDGSIQFLGRVDGQIKVNGFRIEAMEIQGVIEENQDVVKAVVLGTQSENGATRLKAFVSTTSNSFSVETIKKTLANKLPYFMIPGQFIVVDNFPLTQNGKVDMKKLATMESQITDQSATDPKNEREKILVEIFEQIFAVKVKIEHNFFELGGDSILAIQVSSKANEKGWLLKPKDIFEKRTIQHMATVMKRSTKLVNTKSKGELPLSPIQQWFFAQNFLYPNHWNQAIRMKCKISLPLSLFQKAFDFIVNTHDSLRLRFKNEGTGWRQLFTEDDNTVELSYFDFSSHDNPDRDVQTKSEYMQQLLDIEKGPLVYAGYFNMGSHRDDDIVIIIHHLLVDMVSWQILLRDLDVAVESLLNGRVVELLPERSTYQQWIQHLPELAEHVKSEEDQLWNEHVKPSSLAGLDKGTEGAKVYLEKTITKDLSQALIQEVPKYFDTKANEVILSAVVCSLQNLTKDSNVVMDLESHGRYSLDDELDLSSTIGWFTSVYPMQFKDIRSQATGDILKSVKKKLRQPLYGGMGFGLSMWQEGKQKATGALFSYNYLGKLDQTFFESEIFDVHSFLSESVRHSEEKRLYLLEFEPYFINNQLYIRVAYYPSVHSTEKITALTEEIIESVEKFISYCTNTEEVGFVSSDFPEANLDQASLEKFLSTIEQKP